MKQYQQQQGDVWIESIDSIPAGAKLVTDATRLILAEGEATGHHHQIICENPENVEVFEVFGGQRFLNLKEDCTLVHEEHHAQILSAGIHRFGQISQYDYDREETQRVAD